MAVNYALIGYPLSRRYRKCFEEMVGGEPKYLLLSELRRLPVLDLIRRFRSLRADHLYLPVEDVNAGAILRILQIMAALTNTHRIEVVLPNLKRKQLNRWHVGLSLLTIVGASVSASVSAFRCSRELTKLRKEARAFVKVGPAKRVLYLKTNLWFGVQAGGSVGHIAGVVNALARKGYALDFASIEPPLMVDSRVRFLRVRPPSEFGFPGELNLYCLQRLFTREVLRDVSREAYSFIYQRMSVANYTGVMLSREMKLPFVLEYNGSEAWVSKNWGRPLRYHDLAACAENVCLKHAHIVVTVSEVLREELIERGIDPERIAYYPNCIDPAVFNPNRFTALELRSLRRHFGISPDAVLVTFIGTFGQWHGVEVLAKAIRQWAERGATWLKQNRVHFMLIGDGLKMERVREILSSDFCKAFYTFTGLVSQEEAPKYLAASDVLVSPHIQNVDGSRFFGSPTKLFEYMAMGKGIVASDLEQMGQVLKKSLRTEWLPLQAPQPDDENLAVLSPPGDVAGIISGIRFLVENPQWRALLGQNARKEALSKYSWQHHVETILSAIRRLPDN